MYVCNQDTLEAILTTEIAVGGIFEAPKMALYTNNVFPARGMLVGDFIFANFGGLTNQKAVTWGVPFLNALQQAEVLGGLLSWLTVTDEDPAVTAYGWILLNTAGAAWLAAERFAEPQAFGPAGTNLSIVPRLVMDT